MKKATQSTSIKVALRLRPLNELEKSTGGACCLTYTDKAIKVKVEGEEKPYDFTFDHIFGPETPQGTVYDKVAKPVLHGLMDGFNGTIFAYGQTSSGKTFTMEGPDIVDSEEKKGIIPRMMGHLFELILNSSENIEFNVKVSFLELYNEKLIDLFDPRKNNLQIKEDKTKGIFVHDVTEIYVTSAEQMRQIHKKGSENRTIAATRMNERSSRSHSIFILNLIQKDINTEASKHSKLYFVDLAGSEKISKTHVTGQQLEEAKNINKSLSALGLVINALTDKKENSHVPYRDSKLTRLLQESLGGNSQTSLILACSMCSYNDKETLSTLRFGNRAKSIKNAPKVNVERSAKEFMMLLDAAEKKIKDQEALIVGLQQQLNAVAQGNPINLSAITHILPGVSVSTSDQQNLEEIEEKDGEETTREEKKDEEETIKDEEQSKAAAGQAGSASLTLLKQQIQIADMTEEIQELNKTNKELEKEVEAKSQEIYSLNGKVMHLEHQLTELTTKNLEALDTFRAKFDKVSYENQEKNATMAKFLKAINRLKSDLHFMYISKNLTMLDVTEKAYTSGTDKATKEAQEQRQQQQMKEDLLINSIQKTMEMIEEIEKDLQEDNEDKFSTTKDTTALLESLLKDSQTSSSKKELSHKRSLQRLNNEGASNTDELTNNSDEEFKENTSGTYDLSWNDKGSMDNIDSLRHDAESVESYDDLAQRLQTINNDENKVAELLNLVAIQRKTITNLSKTNSDLLQTNQKNYINQEKKVESYVGKIEALEKSYAEKTKDFETKIASLKALLEAKIKEIDELRSKQEKETLDKNKAISDLKYQNDRMQKIILGNDLPKRVLELENKLREVALERQGLFEEVYKLREDVDEKNDLLDDKNSQIQLLQNNLNTLSTELEILKHFRPKPTQAGPVKKRDKHSDRAAANDSDTPQWIKDQMVMTDKHVIKPIRGGGGNIKKFERDNFLIFEKPTVLGNSSLTRQSSVRGSMKSSKDGSKVREEESFEERGAGRRSIDEKGQGWRKLGEMMKSEKGRHSISNADRMTSLFARKSSIAENDTLNKTGEAGRSGKVTDKSNRVDKEDPDAQSSLKSIFSGVKSFFS